MSEKRISKNTLLENLNIDISSFNKVCINAGLSQSCCFNYSNIDKLHSYLLKVGNLRKSYHELYLRTDSIIKWASENE